MSVATQTKKPINLTENLYQREKWIEKLVDTAKKELSAKNFELFEEYNNEMIRLSHSKITRQKNLTHYVKLSQIYNKNWKNITEKDVKKIVGIIMEKHSDNGQESNYTFDLKKSLRISFAEELKSFENMRFEIQVRTILQHAWAEIEHDDLYKNPGQIPSSLRRRFFLVSNVLESADNELNELHKKLKN